MTRKLFAICIMLFISGLQLIAGTGPQQQGFRLPKGVTEEDMVPGTLIIKLKPEFRPVENGRITDNKTIVEAFRQVGAYEINQKFPTHRKPAAERNAQGLRLVDLTL